MLKAAVMAQLNKKKVIGLLLCPGAVMVGVCGWAGGIPAIGFP
jgi:hypothetical protein